MHVLVWRGGAVILASVLGACSVAEDGPNCSSESAQSVLTQVLWDSIEQQFSATAGAQDAKPFMDLARTRMQIQVSGITTTETSKNVRQVSCQATLNSTLPEVPNADFSLLRTAIAKEPGNVRLDDRTLTGSVDYHVQLSDDRTTTRVEARGFRTFTDVMGGVASALYINDMQQKALVAEEAATSRQPISPQPFPVPSVTKLDQRIEAGEQYQAADKLLNEAYQAARASMSEAQRVALRDQQREWIKTRDATCAAERIEADSNGNIAGGTAMELAMHECKTRLTRERAKQISALKG